MLVEPITKALAKNPSDRWESAGDFVTELRNLHSKVQLEVGGSVRFPDKNLETAVREALGRADGPLTSQDLETLKHLADKGHGGSIRDLTGLEYCVNPTELEIYGNQLSGNQIADLAPLAGLTQLTRLSLTKNQITDLAPLRGLTQLTELSLYTNQIADVTLLAGLKLLEWLDLGKNQITDPTPLAELTKLSSLNLSGNPLNEESARWYENWQDTTYR